MSTAELIDLPDRRQVHASDIWSAILVRSSDARRSTSATIRSSWQGSRATTERATGADPDQHVRPGSRRSRGAEASRTWPAAGVAPTS